MFIGYCARRDVRIAWAQSLVQRLDPVGPPLAAARISSIRPRPRLVNAGPRAGDRLADAPVYAARIGPAAGPGRLGIGGSASDWFEWQIILARLVGSIAGVWIPHRRSEARVRAFAGSGTKSNETANRRRNFLLFALDPSPIEMARWSVVQAAI